MRESLRGGHRCLFFRLSDPCPLAPLPPPGLQNTRFHFYGNAAVYNNRVEFFALLLWFCFHIFFRRLPVKSHSKVFTRIRVFYALTYFLSNSRYAADRAGFPEHPRIFHVDKGGEGDGICCTGEAKSIACLSKIFTNSEIRLVTRGLEMLRVLFDTSLCENRLQCK